jgi:predicted molibdopterin-dependent oxidoreductase YjgC
VSSIADFAKAEIFLVIGSDITEAYPVAAAFIKNGMIMNTIP